MGDHLLLHDTVLIHSCNMGTVSWFARYACTLDALQQLLRSIVSSSKCRIYYSRWKNLTALLYVQ